MVTSLTVKETAADIMSDRPLTVRPDAPITEVFARMGEHGIAMCPVVTQAGELCGIVSRVDLLRALRPYRELRALNAAEVRQLPVREIMRRGVVTVEPDDPLVAVVDLFVDTGLHAFPVVRRGAGPPVVIGLVTQGDALLHLMEGAATRR